MKASERKCPTFLTNKMNENSLNKLNNLNNELRKCFTFYLRVGQYELFKENVRKYTNLSISQAVDKLIEQFNKECEQRKQQPTLIQYIKAEPHSQVLIQNKIENPIPKCHFCTQPATTSAVYLPTNKTFPVCQEHAEELASHPKWKVEKR